MYLLLHHGGGGVSTLWYGCFLALQAEQPAFHCQCIADGWGGPTCETPYEQFAPTSATVGVGGREAVQAVLGQGWSSRRDGWTRQCNGGCASGCWGARWLAAN